ncbi:MAG: hypothetical protein ABIF08_02510 [Nanoarchaeota archaeon]
MERKNKRKQNFSEKIEKKHVYAGVLILIVAAAFVVFGSSTGFMILGFQPSTSVYISQEQEQLYRTYFDTDRPLHCQEGRCINPLVYEDLPEWPDDAEFEAITILVKDSKINPADIEEEFYKQPEFFPSHIKGISYEAYLYPGGRPSICCEGAYPGKVIISHASRGDSFESVTFFLSPPGSPYFRGAQFIPVFPQTFGAQGKFYTQNAEEVKKYFDIEITPNIFKFEPTYPKYRYDWNARVKVNVKIDENTPQGYYAIGITTIAPPEEINYKWQLEHKMAYTPTLTGGMFSTGNPPYTIVLNVV